MGPDFCLCADAARLWYLVCVLRLKRHLLANRSRAYDGAHCISRKIGHQARILPKGARFCPAGTWRVKT